MKQFDHIGIVVLQPHPGESWVPFSRVWVTDPRMHPQRIEYIRAAEMPDVEPTDKGLRKLWHLPHVAHRVGDWAAAIAGEEVILGPLEPADFGSVAFIHKDGAVTEYLQYAGLDAWFGQPTPWQPAGSPGQAGR